MKIKRKGERGAGEPEVQQEAKIMAECVCTLDKHRSSKVSFGTLEVSHYPVRLVKTCQLLPARIAHTSIIGSLPRRLHVLCTSRFTVLIELLSLLLK